MENVRQVHHKHASKAVAEHAEYSLCCPAYETILYYSLIVEIGNGLDNHIYTEALAKATLLWKLL